MAGKGNLSRIKDYLGQIIEGLESDDVNVRGYNAVLLTRLTDRPADFKADAPKDERREQIARWREWFSQSGDLVFAELGFSQLVCEKNFTRKKRPGGHQPEQSRLSKVLMQLLLMFTMAASLFTVFFALHLVETYQGVFPSFVSSGFLFFFFLVLLLTLLYLPLGFIIWINQKRYLQSLARYVRQRAGARPPAPPG